MYRNGKIETGVRVKTKKGVTSLMLRGADLRLDFKESRRPDLFERKTGGDSVVNVVDLAYLRMVKTKTKPFYVLSTDTKMDSDQIAIVFLHDSVVPQFSGKGGRIRRGVNLDQGVHILELEVGGCCYVVCNQGDREVYTRVCGVKKYRDDGTFHVGVSRKKVSRGEFITAEHEYFKSCEDEKFKIFQKEDLVSA